MKLESLSRLKSAFRAGTDDIVDDGSVGTLTGCCIKEICVTDGDGFGIGTAAGVGRRNSASNFAVTESKSSSRLYRDGELLAELKSVKRGVCSSHRLISLSVCSVSSSSASIFVDFCGFFKADAAAAAATAAAVAAFDFRGAFGLAVGSFGGLAVVVELAGVG